MIRWHRSVDTSNPASGGNTAYSASKPSSKPKRSLVSGSCTDMTAELASTRQGVLHGLAVYAGLRGTERAARVRRTIDSGDLGSTMIAMWMEFVFGQLWSRDTLDAKQRSLVTIAILIALRQTEELKNHIRIGLTNGLTVREIEEATIQAAAYAGFPAAHTASNAMLEVLQDS